MAAKIIAGARGKFVKDGETIGFTQSVSVSGEEQRVVNFENVRLIKGYNMKDLCESKMQVLNPRDIDDMLEEVEIERVYGHGTLNLLTGQHKMVYSNKETLE